MITSATFNTFYAMNLMDPIVVQLTSVANIPMTFLNYIEMHEQASYAYET